MQKLSNAAAGKYTIKWIFTEPGLKNTLSEMKLEVGKEVTVISNRLGMLLVRSEAGSFAIDPDAVFGITV